MSLTKLALPKMSPAKPAETQIEEVEYVTMRKEDFARHNKRVFAAGLATLMAIAFVIAHVQDPPASASPAHKAAEVQTSSTVIEREAPKADAQ